MAASEIALLNPRTGHHTLFLETAANTGAAYLAMGAWKLLPEARTNLLAQYTTAQTRTGGQAC